LSRPLLLDVNVLIALTHSAHVHHALVQDWVQAQGKLAWSTCTVTQLGFVRLAAMPAIGGDITSQALHWPCWTNCWRIPATTSGPTRKASRIQRRCARR